MSPYGNKQYNQVPAGASSREIEAWALTQAARRLRDAQTAPEWQEPLLAAVRLNWRLWTIFQAELSSPESPVPLEMKQNMLSLCNFVDKRSVAIIADPSPDKVDILISVNREIAAGLFTHPDQANSQHASMPATEAALGATTIA